MSYSYEENYDYCTRLTRNGVLRSDGVIFTEDTFIESHRTKVPIVWNNDYSLHCILGMASLVVKDDGVYAYCIFNDSEYGVIAKKLLLEDEDVEMSFYANKVKKDPRNNKKIVSAKIHSVNMIPEGTGFKYEDET